MLSLLRTLAAGMACLLFAGCGPAPPVTTTPTSAAVASVVSASPAATARSAGPLSSSMSTLSPEDRWYAEVAERYLEARFSRGDWQNSQGGILDCKAATPQGIGTVDLRQPVAGSPTLVFGPAHLMDGSLLMWFDQPVTGGGTRTQTIRLAIQIDPRLGCVRHFSELTGDTPAR